MAEGPAPAIRLDESGKTFLGLDPDSPLVTATPFLPWIAHREWKEIPVHLAVLTFLSHCSLDQQDVTTGAFDQVSVLSFNLQARAWTSLPFSMLSRRVGCQARPFRTLTRSTTTFNAYFYTLNTLQLNSLTCGHQKRRDDQEQPARAQQRSRWQQIHPS